MRVRLFVVSILMLSAAAQAQYTLEATPSTRFPGQLFHVCWTAPAGGTAADDWIAMYVPSANNQTYLTYQYTGGPLSGCFDFLAVGTAGPYEFRYLTRGGYVDVATSNTVTVLCSSDGHCGDADNCSADKCHDNVCYHFTADDGPYSVESLSEIAPRRGTVRACWSIPQDATTTNDWVGLYRVGAPSVQYSTYIYTNGAASGCGDLPMPNLTGQFEFRLSLQNNYCQVAASDPFTLCDPVASQDCPCFATRECDDDDLCTTDTCTQNVCSNVDPPFGEFSLSACPGRLSPGFPITVRWSAPPDAADPTDWIGIFVPGTPNTSFGPYNFVGALTEGVMLFNAPGTPGDYEFRYLLVNGYCDVTTSNVVTVCPNCSPNRDAALPGFTACLLGPDVTVSPSCIDYDINCSQHVDLRDFAVIQRTFAAP